MFGAASFTVSCSCDTSGTKGKGGQFGVGIALKVLILEELGGNGTTVYQFSANEDET